MNIRNLTSLAFVHFGSRLRHIVLTLSTYFVCKHYNIIVVIDYQTQFLNKKQFFFIICIGQAVKSNSIEKYYDTVKNKPTFQGNVNKYKIREVK